MKNLLLAIDQGTTGTKVVVYDINLNQIAQDYTEFPQHFPQPGWVEHDLEDIWKSFLGPLQGVLKKIQDPSQIAAIGITNQRETVGFWDRKTLQPLGRALVWQDRRTAPQCQELIQAGMESEVQTKTGLVIDPYFSGTKVSWALKNQSAIQKAADRGNLCIGTIDAFLVSRLSGGNAFATEPSNASRTLCYNIQNLQWDAGLCEVLGIKPSLWPEVKPSFGVFGKTSQVPGLPDGIPITGILGDQQAALLGQACLEEGTAKCTYGTGAFLLLNTGKKPVLSRHRLLTTIAWSQSPRETTYALEGSAFIAGAAVQWLRDGLQLIQNSSEIEALASSVASSEGVVFVPSLTGLGAPYWNPHATGLIKGLTRGTTRGHLARAALEGVAFQNFDILEAMQKDLGKKITRLNVDGGAAMNNLLMQFQADLLQIPLQRPKIFQTTSLGAIFAAGIGAGIWSDFAEIRKIWKLEKEFKPQMKSPQRETHLKNWKKAVSQVTL